MVKMNIHRTQCDKESGSSKNYNLIQKRIQFSVEASMLFEISTGIIFDAFDGREYEFKLIILTVVHFLLFALHK